jgi:hypothetical protein
LATTIQNLIQSAAPGSTVTVPGGTYNVSGLTLPGNLTLKAAGDVTLQGNMAVKSNTVLSGFNFSGGTVDISNSTGVTIQNSVFKGGQHSVKFDAARDASITNNSFHNVSNTVLDGWGLDQSTISGNKFFDCYQPINLAFNNIHSQGRDITVSDNYFTGTQRMPIEVGPSGAYTSNLVVKGNWSENMNNVGQQSGWSTDVAYSIVPTYGVNTQIKGNYAKGIGSGVGIEMNGSGEISGNYIDNFWYGTIVYGKDFNVHDNALVNQSIQTVLNYAGNPGTALNNQTTSAGFPMPQKPGTVTPTPSKDHSPAPVDGVVGGKGNPVYAADDHYNIDAGKALHFSRADLVSNDKGADGGLKVTSIDAKSAAGVSLQTLADGSIVYKAAATFKGTDTITYKVQDKDGSNDTAKVIVDVKNGGAVASPTPTPTPDKGAGNTVHAADDHYKLSAGEKLWFNTRYLTWNDKGLDGGLHVISIDAVSDRGVKVSVDPAGFAKGTTAYKAPADFHGTDHIKYTVADKDGSWAVGHVVIDIA